MSTQEPGAITLALKRIADALERLAPPEPEDEQCKSVTLALDGLRRRCVFGAQHDGPHYGGDGVQWSDRGAL